MSIDELDYYIERYTSQNPSKDIAVSRAGDFIYHPENTKLKGSKWDRLANWEWLRE
jgi:hypothetical protein